MALKERIENDLKAALLERRRFDLDVLRGLKAAILNEEVAQGKRDEGLDDTAIEVVIAKEVKKRHEARALYESNGRQELADNELAEANVLALYLPEQASDDEVRAAADAVIATLETPGPQAMGQVIGALKAQFGTSADGATIARIVKEQLQK